MNIIVVDDEKIVLDDTMKSVRAVVPEAQLDAFRKGSDVLEYARENQIDVAFVDINMPEMDGLELGRKLLQLQPNLNLIYCSAYEDYIAEAFREVRCNGYLTKPIEQDDIREEMNHLRIPLHYNNKVRKRVRFQCFGRFEVFLDERPLIFENAKTKELLAFLVKSNGGVCSNQEIISVLWDDDERHDSYFKKIRKDLVDTLEKHECLDIIWRQRGGIGVDPKRVNCDYYEWKKENHGEYYGEFMIQYAWAYVPLYEW